MACNYGSTAWKGLNAGGKAIAASAIDLLTKPEEIKRLRSVPRSVREMGGQFLAYCPISASVTP